MKNINHVNFLKNSHDLIHVEEFVFENEIQINEINEEKLLIEDENQSHHLDKEIIFQKFKIL